jgi:PTH1 family peptidyl-tRNA hydrolase
VFWRRRQTEATKLVCGLGNPGEDYESHRHNVGFLVVDALARRLETSVGQRKFDGRFGQASSAGQRIVLLKPQTFMNRSGASVAAALRFYKIDYAHLLVIHDELDLPFGRLQLKAGGGSGGHNGLNSIIEYLGREDFARLRFGIGKPVGPDAKERVVGHVLSRFNAEQGRELDELVPRAAEAAEIWWRDGLPTAMNRFNKR